MESLLLDIPCVCKWWCKGSLDPVCWNQLIYPDLETFGDCFTSRLRYEFQLMGDDVPATAFIKFVVKSSHTTATKLVLPRCCTEEALIYVTHECPV
ncbi:hypothetical protein F0562_032504 [Nyssa sinensis]|uniref:FBD domain-containing protein n=1 Tax=Nyssa sinensis TaxID=561372 RepID=A0A5J5AU10_9ASTE|nr:hypothetical protein F0562_032504 [Nyssa sinensis]